MSPQSLAVVVAQAGLALVGLVAGGAKVAGRPSQVAVFERFGYPTWLRLGTGLGETVAGLVLLAAFAGSPELAAVGSAVFGVVLLGAVASHARVGDPPSELAVPAVLLLVAALVGASRLGL